MGNSVKFKNMFGHIKITQDRTPLQRKNAKPQIVFNNNVSTVEQASDMSKDNVPVQHCPGKIPDSESPTPRTIKCQKLGKMVPAGQHSRVVNPEPTRVQHSVSPHTTQEEKTLHAPTNGNRHTPSVDLDSPHLTEQDASLGLVATKGHKQ
ncbi:unnamed protein product [Heterobilharzia americana]|nr:unnamed protein product [Heterobilharzia americana]CAH8635648.1 unnamed protein product [Heterobilharzia americana]